MTQLTTLQILALSRKKLLEVSDAIFEDADLLLYANLSKDEIALRLFSNDLITPVTLTFSGGSVAAPADFQSQYLSKDSQLSGEGNIFEWVSIEDFRRRTYDRMLTIIGGQIKVYPEATGIVYMDYYKKLPDLTTVVNPSLDSSLHELIIYGVLYRAFEDLQDYELSKFYRDKFEVELGIKGQSVSFSEESSQQGGQLFNGITII